MEFSRFQSFVLDAVPDFMRRVDRAIVHVHESHLNLVNRIFHASANCRKFPGKYFTVVSLRMLFKCRNCELALKFFDFELNVFQHFYNLHLYLSLDEGLGPKHQSHLYSVVLEFFLCYSTFIL